MAYRQAQRYYGLNPYGDIDRDSVPNYIDCKPFDPNEQGIFKRAIGKLTGDKFGQTKEEYEKEKASYGPARKKFTQAVEKAYDVTKKGLSETGKFAKEEFIKSTKKDFGGDKIIEMMAGARPIPETRIEQKLAQVGQRYETGQPIIQQPLAGETQLTPEETMQLMQLQQLDQMQKPVQYQNPNYTYRSHYYGKKGYLYLPSVPRPRKFRPVKTRPVNPFRRARERFGPVQKQCSYCGHITTSSTCPKCFRGIF